MQQIEPAETEIVKKLVKKNWVCLDIGANEGYYTILLSGLCDYVYAFEAEPRNYALLSWNIKNIDNVHAKSLIVSDKDGWANLYLCTGDYNGANGMHRIYPSKWCSDVSISIPSIKVDSFFDEAMDYQIIKFIKMDIEGSEYGALKGMEQLLRKHHPTILMEYHPPSIIEYGANPKDEYDFLTNLGYDIRLVPNIDESISYEDLYKETMKEPSGRNILCLKQ